MANNSDTDSDSAPDRALNSEVAGDTTDEGVPQESRSGDQSEDDDDCPDGHADRAGGGWSLSWPTQTEAGSAYNGPLSTNPEWHALAHGVYMGLTTMPWKTPPEPDNPDVEKESHYYRGGYVLGTFAQLVILAGFGETAFDMAAFA